MNALGSETRLRANKIIMFKIAILSATVIGANFVNARHLYSGFYFLVALFLFAEMSVLFVQQK